MFPRFNNLYHPDPAGGPATPLTRGGILDVLNANDKDDKDDKTPETELEIPDDEDADDTLVDETEDTKETKKTKDGEDEDEEVDELAELEEELKDPKPEDLELTTPVKKREILAKYPDVFKDFPSLEKAYYRELAFTRVFPTIDDAREAASAVNVLNSFEADLKEGKTTDLFKAILKDDPNAFNKLADSYLDNLKETSEQAYYHVIGNVAKDFVETMVRAGKKAENKELQDAATTLYQFMFGNVDWSPKQKLAIDDKAPENEERVKLQKEREEFETSKFTERQGELMTGVDNRIKSVIDANIDKKGQMVPFAKKAAVREVKEKLDSLVKSDSRFQTIVKQLWQKAKESKYSQDSLQRIESAHVSKAKSLLPTIIVSVRKEALKNNSVSRQTDKTKEDETPRTRPRNSATPKTEADQTDFKNKPKPEESSLDFLLRRN